MANSGDLVDRLRAYIPVEGQEGLRVRDGLLRKAADEIERLQEEVKQLEASWKNIKWCAQGCVEDRPKTSAEAAGIGGFGIGIF